MWDSGAVMFVPVEGSISVEPSQEEMPGRDCYLPLPYEHHNPHPQWYLRVLNSDAGIPSIPKCPLHSR